MKLIFIENIEDVATDWIVFSKREKVGWGTHHESKSVMLKGTEIGRYKSHIAGMSLPFKE